MVIPGNLGEVMFPSWLVVITESSKFPFQKTPAQISGLCLGSLRPTHSPLSDGWLSPAAYRNLVGSFSSRTGHGLSLSLLQQISRTWCVFYLQI